jgi:hypothetical protein
LKQNSFKLNFLIFGGSKLPSVLGMPFLFSKSSICKNPIILSVDIHSSVILVIIVGIEVSGKRRMLKSVIDTKAFSTVSTLAGSTQTYVANDARDICKKIENLMKNSKKGKERNK